MNYTCFLLGTFLSVGIIFCGTSSQYSESTNILPEGILIDSNQSNWQKYEDEKMKFSIEYHGNYAVDKSFVYELLGQGKDIHGVSFTIPESFAEGTNLSGDTYISVEWLPSSGKCKADNFLFNVTDSYSGTTSSGMVYTVAESSESATGNRYEETIYCVKSSSYCFAIRLFIHSVNIANYDPGTVREFDRAALLRIYYDMVGSFRML